MTLEEKIKIVQSKGFELIYSNIDGAFLRNEDHGLSAHILPHLAPMAVRLVKYQRVDSKLVRKHINVTIELFKQLDDLFFNLVLSVLNKA